MMHAIANHLWQSTIFGLAAALLTLVFRRNRAGVRYWLWFAASVKFLVPFALLISLGSHWHWPGGAAANELPAPAPPIPFAVVEIAAPFSAVPAPAPASHHWTAYALFAIWLAGLLAIAVLRVRAWLHLRRVLGAAAPIDIPLTIEVRSSAALLEPGIAGFFRPILLLPAGIVDRLAPAQLEAVLAHELCHARRRDNLTSLMHMMVEALFWVHPLVWFIGARMVEERERACDEAVLSLGSQPRDYADAILTVCKLYLESPLVCVPGVTGANLKKRIRGILDGRALLELSRTRKAILAAAAIAAVAAPIVIGTFHAVSVHAQSAPASGPKFEVASIKPCTDKMLAGGWIKDGGPGANPSPDHLTTPCQSVADLIHSAYIVYANGQPNRDPANPRVEGGPAWIRSDSYRVDAKADGAPGTGIMNGPMMQALLSDRFRLQVHRETRDVPVYAVTVAEGGPKLHPFREGSCTPIEVGRLPNPRPANPCRTLIGRAQASGLELTAQGATLDTLARLLFLVMDRPVIDRTGIAGRFDFHLEFAKDETTPAIDPRGDLAFPTVPVSDDAAAPSIFTALQRELGLKLKPSTGPREFLVIEHIERPTEN